MTPSKVAHVRSIHVVVLEGSWLGVYKGQPFATRFTTWLQVRGDRIARQIDYLDYATFRRLTSPPKAP